MKTIIFIEDERALQTTFQNILKQEGYNVVPALDGKEGLKLVKDKKPDLVLLDLILPKIDGIEVLREVKKNEETKEIPVIVLTNLEELKKIEEALELGAKTYLIKANYTVEEVIEKIKKILGE